MALHHTATGALAACSLVLSGCTGTNISSGPGLAPYSQAQPSPYRIQPGSSIVINSTTNCLVNGMVTGGSGKINTGLVQKAQQDLQAAGFNARIGNSQPAAPNEFQFNISANCNSYNSLGIWFYVFTIGFGPGWDNQAVLLDTTLTSPEGKVLGRARQAHRLSTAMSLYSPAGLFWGQLQPDDISAVAELNPSALFAIPSK